MSDQDILGRGVRVLVPLFRDAGANSRRHRMGCMTSRGSATSREVYIFFIIAGPVKAAYVLPLWKIKPFVVLCFPSKSGWERIYSVFFF